MKNITLVVLAAGIGSRFKGGIKQLTKVGQNNETIMELSIKDAKKIGFTKVIFIIREELKKEFEELIIPNIDIPYDFAYQKIEDIPVNIKVNREKPWGTGQALLSVKNKIDNPFVIINADDYYGYEALKELYDYLLIDNDNQAMVAFKLKNTVSVNNGVTRGKCNINNNKLIDIKETYRIKYENGKYFNDEGFIDHDTYVSMNLWGFRTSIFKYFEEEFINFFKTAKLDSDEYLIPTVINNLLHDNKINIQVFYSEQKCVGITYKEDVILFKDI